jgi:hypothetical protein
VVLREVLRALCQVSEGLFKRAFYLLYELLLLEHGTVGTAGGATVKISSNATVARAEREIIDRFTVFMWNQLL